MATGKVAQWIKPTDKNTIYQVYTLNKVETWNFKEDDPQIKSPNTPIKAANDSIQLSQQPIQLCQQPIQASARSNRLPSIIIFRHTTSLLYHECSFCNIHHHDHIPHSTKTNYQTSLINLAFKILEEFGSRQGKGFKIFVGNVGGDNIIFVTRGLTHKNSCAPARPRHRGYTGGGKPPPTTVPPVQPSGLQEGA